MSQTDEKANQQVAMAGGLAASTRIPPWHLIPTVALDRIAERFQKGIERKGDKAWNAASNNQACLQDLGFALERTAHAMRHAAQLRDKLATGDIEGILSDDDAGAIAWAGVFLICVVDKLLQANGRTWDVPAPQNPQVTPTPSLFVDSDDVPF